MEDTFNSLILKAYEDKYSPKSLVNYDKLNKIAKINLRISTPGFLVQSRNQIKFLENDFDDPPILLKNEKEIFRIKTINYKFYFFPNPLNQIWKILGSPPSIYSLKSEFENEIKKDDIYKLGDILLKVIHVNNIKAETLKKYKSTENSSNILACPILKNENVLKNEFDNVIERICKFCFCKDESDNNKLLSLCACKGSVGLVHSQCLFKWLKTKESLYYKEIKNNYSVYCIAYEKFSCEICNTVFSTNFKFYKDKLTSNLLNFPIPNKEKNFIIFETIISFGHESVLLLYILVIEDLEMNLKNELTEITIGSSDLCDIKVPGEDKNMSLLHSTILFKKGAFYIYDKGSKFGTLVLMRNKMKIKKEITIQSDNFLIKSYIKYNSTKLKTSYNDQLKIREVDNRDQSNYFNFKLDMILKEKNFINQLLNKQKNERENSDKVRKLS